MKIKTATTTKTQKTKVKSKVQKGFKATTHIRAGLTSWQPL